MDTVKTAIFKLSKIYRLIQFKKIIHMNTLIRFSLIFNHIFSASQLVCQVPCKVLKPEIAGTYTGKCKDGLAQGKGIATATDRYEGFFVKGLPQGEGIYTYSNGNMYTGEWVEGMRHGIGKYIMKTDGKDSIQSGLWQQDRFIGPKPPKPAVIYNSGIDRYDFQKNNTTMQRVLIDFYQNGSRNSGISNFLISTSSGADTKLGQSIGYDFVTFPVTIKLSFTSWNKFHTVQYNVKFDFEISEPGDWMVTLNN